MEIDPRSRRLYGKVRTGQLKDVVFADVGIGGTGVALWRLLERHIAKKPYEVARWSFLRGDLSLRFDKYTARFAAFCQRSHTASVVIEVPLLWASSEKSYSAGTRGDLTKQALLCGKFDEIARRLGISTILVLPSQWKGQLSKKAVTARILRALDCRYEEHVEDAVGMGLSYAGVL